MHAHRTEVRCGVEGVLIPNEGKIADAVIFGVVDVTGFFLQDLAFAASPNVQYQHASGLKRFFRSFEILQERGAILEDHVAEIQSHCQLNLRGMRVQNVAMDERQAVLLIHGQGRYVMFYAPIKRRPIQIDADGMVFGVLSHEIRGQRGGTAEVFTQ